MTYNIELKSKGLRGTKVFRHSKFILWPKGSPALERAARAAKRVLEKTKDL
jgi:hypothetical protein